MQPRDIGNGHALGVHRGAGERGWGLILMGWDS
jgi:hypothetical protein